MTSTTTPPGTPSHSDASAGLPRDLHAAAVLDTMVACRRTADQHEANLLALAVEYATLHPTTDLMDVAATDESISTGDDTDGPVGTVWATTGLTGRRPDAWCPLAGAGTPAVSVEAVAALGAALNVTYASAMRLVADALELAYRLPRLWALVHDGHLPAWRAREVAAHTPTLTGEVVDFMDRHLTVLAMRGHTPPPGQLRALVHEALLACDPDTAAGREDAALHARDVAFDHRRSVETTTMTATLDTLDALDLDATLTDLAAQMGRLGDTDPLGVRRAHALGSLAHPQRTLDLFGDPRSSGRMPFGTGSTPTSTDPQSDGPQTRTPWNSTTATLYVHVDADDLRGHVGDRTSTETSGGTSGGMVEKLGPATFDLLRDWLRRVDRLTIRPVLRPATDAGSVGHRSAVSRRAVDRHDPPDPIRQAVILRDGHCVFPGCSTDARSCDLDHIDPYVPLDHGGPPGQTTADNLACLCRRHHRLKTFTAWTYQRTDAGYTWTSPTSRTYTTVGRAITPPRRC